MNSNDLTGTWLALCQRGESIHLHLLPETAWDHLSLRGWVWDPLRSLLPEWASLNSHCSNLVSCFAIEELCQVCYSYFLGTKSYASLPLPGWEYMVVNENHWKISINMYSWLTQDDIFKAPKAVLVFRNFLLCLTHSWRCLGSIPVFACFRRVLYHWTVFPFGVLRLLSFPPALLPSFPSSSSSSSPPAPQKQRTRSQGWWPMSLSPVLRSQEQENFFKFRTSLVCVASKCQARQCYTVRQYQIDR